MRANAPTSRDGAIAWWLACQPGLWHQMSLSSASQSMLVTRGLDLNSALELAARQYPDHDPEHVKICLQMIEVSRLKTEARLRDGQR